LLGKAFLLLLVTVFAAAASALVALALRQALGMNASPTAAGTIGGVAGGMTGAAVMSRRSRGLFGRRPVRPNRMGGTRQNGPDEHTG